MKKTEVRCSVCVRDDVATINAALRAQRPLRALEQQFGTSKSALDRHREHIASASKRAPSPASPRELATPVPPVPPVASPFPPRMTGDEVIASLEALVHQQLQRLTVPSDLSEGERSKLQSSAIAALGLLAKLLGRTEISERRIIASPAWRRLESVLIDALSPWPEALGAAGRALKAAGEAEEES